MNSTLILQKGIKDHKKKLHTLALLMGVENVLVKIIGALLKHSGDNPSDSQGIATAVCKYTRESDGTVSSPTGSQGIRYLNCVESLLISSELKEDNLKSFYVNSSFKEFALAIPMKHMNNNKELKNIITPIYNMVDTLYRTYSFIPEKPVDIEVMFKRNSIDQLIIYDSDKAANAWTSVLNNRSYKQYGECEEALNKVLNSKQMESFFENFECDGFIKLGAGSTSKDKMIIRSFHRPSNKCSNVHFSLVDYSNAMLDISSKALGDFLKNNTLSKNKNIIFEKIKIDFTCLTNNIHLRRSGVPVMFFITGGTIGNLDEGSFLSSILRIAEPDDLLIICCETLPDKVNEDYHDYLLSKYDHDDAKEMLSPALQKIWYLIDDREHSFNEAIKLIKPKIVEGRWDGVTGVDNSISVVFEYPTSPAIRLITSTRYEENSFVRFVEAYGFELLTTQSGNSNDKFKSFMFRVK